MKKSFLIRTMIRSNSHKTKLSFNVALHSKMGKPIFFWVTLCLWFLSSLVVVETLPTGAAACPANQEAPGGPHLRSGYTTGSLKKGGFSLSANGVVAPTNGTIQLKSIKGGATYKFVVSGATFKGILFRLSNTTPKQVTPGSKLQIASACGNVGGVTHKDNSFKTTGQMSVFLNKTGTYKLDLSVVVQNNATASKFYYTGYTVKLV